MRLLRRLLLLVVLAAVVAGAVGAWMVTRAPDLGAPPGGTDDGRDETAIGLHLATGLAPLLLPGHTHASVVLSERDLTTVLAAHLPADGSLRNPEARVRADRLVVSGVTALGPVDVVGVGYCTLRLVTGPDGAPDIAVEVDEVDAGRLPLPSVARAAITDRVRRAVDLDAVLSAIPFSAPARSLLDCVAVRSTGVVLGFHRPGQQADPSSCG